MSLPISAITDSYGHHYIYIVVCLSINGERASLVRLHELQYVTGYEKIDRCDNKLKSSKRSVKSIYLNFFKNIFWVFSETFTIELIWVKASFEKKKKGFRYGGLPFELHPAAFGECGSPFL